MIAKATTAQDDVTGDGTTSTVLLIGELLKQADLYVSEVCMKGLSYQEFYFFENSFLFCISISASFVSFQGVHPRLVTEGFEYASKKTLEFLEGFKQTTKVDRELLSEVFISKSDILICIIYKEYFSCLRG